MKKLIFSFIFFSFSIANAQNVNNFKYVIVPNTFIDFEKEDYQLNTYLKTLLRQKKYEIVVEGTKDFPIDLQQNECLATKTNIQNIKSSFQNRLKVVFTDCNNNTLLELEGNSKIKDFAKGYQDALNVAINKLPIQNASTTNLIKKEENAEVEKVTLDSNISTPKTKEINNHKISTSKKADIAQSTSKSWYNDQHTKVEFIELENGNILLLTGNKKVAEFKPSLKAGIYLVQYYNEENKTMYSIGYKENNSISFEYYDASNQLKLRTFTKVD